ncbi:chromosomal replication initiator protein DnaA [Oricola cellulosilytica]|uniref:Chromosomal replication initiator protein DnaA n=1 Tax=Oricola cellulosilytica TaxID=1429082 RepID=A0A4R0PHX3_9HYPH|nr:chromosomal replication initiator protein DnaA [Oricola cellulosilytica]
MRYDNEGSRGHFEGHAAAPGILATREVVRTVASIARGDDLKKAAKSEPCGSQDIVDVKTVEHDKSFDRVQQKLRAKIGADVFNSWFGRLKLDSATRNMVRMSVPTAFLRSWINSHYIDDLTTFWKAELPEVMQVEIVVRSASKPSARPASQAAQGAPAPVKGGQAIARSVFSPDRAKPSRTGALAELNTSGKLIGSPIDPHYTFDNFVEGKSNRVAMAAAKAGADQGANAARFNPLFLYASVGLGKTHLLQAIANGVLEAEPKKRVVYLTAEYFMWRFASAIRDNSALLLKETLHDIDLLIIDDMQFLQGKKIQSEFCHLINTLLDSARQVVVAADRPPHELESLDPRVRSRLQGGVALEIGAPDFEMRLAMLKQRLENAQREDHSLEIKEDVLAHVAQNVTSSFRELEGAFNQLVFRHSFEPDLSIDRVDDILGHLVRSEEPRKIRIEDIQRQVSSHYNVSRTDMLSNRRTRVIVKPRQIAMYLAKMMTPRSLPEIGRRFGGRDHTTVLHAVRKVEGMIADDAQLAKELELLKRLIQE